MPNIENRSDKYPSALNSGTTIYTIQPGDTLSKIAKITGKDIATLVRINGIKDLNKIRTGEKLYTTEESKTNADNAVQRVADSQRRAADVRKMEKVSNDTHQDENHASGFLVPKSDRLGFALYAIQNIKGISMEEFNNYSMKDQKQIIESLSTKENHDKYIIYAMARDEEIQQKNEAYKASLPPTRYMTPEEQNQFYIENNIPARVATGNQSRWGRENRA